MNNIRKGDEVIVLTGRDKKRRGTVLARVDADHVLVEGVNVVKKHMKANPMANNPGGIVEKTMPIHISNVALFNPATGRGDRVGVQKSTVARSACSVPMVPLSAPRRKGDRHVSFARFLQEQGRWRPASQVWLQERDGSARITKITLNMGVSEAVSDKKVIEHAVSDLTKIAGQKPVVTKTKKAIAGFKIRENYPIGCMVTLRGQRMYEFLDRLVAVALPRVRDFRGISGRAFDGRGNYNIGVKEQIIFPEIEYDKIDALRGLNISITTTAKTDEEAKALLTAFSFPFRN